MQDALVSRRADVGTPSAPLQRRTNISLLSKRAITIVLRKDGFKRIAKFSARRS